MDSAAAAAAGEPPLVRSETVCCTDARGPAHQGADARFPNGTSRGWRWIDGANDFHVAAGAKAMYVADTYNKRFSTTYTRCGRCCCCCCSSCCCCSCCLC